MEVLVETDRLLILNSVAGTYPVFLKALSIIAIDGLEAEVFFSLANIREVFGGKQEVRIWGRHG